MIHIQIFYLLINTIWIYKLSFYYSFLIRFFDIKQKKTAQKALVFSFSPSKKSQGGSQQIAARIACNEVDMLLFFRDPLNPKPNEPNDMNMLRLCDMHNIPVATNIATAEVLIHGLERGDLDWRNILK